MAARSGATSEKSGGRRLDRATIIAAGLELAETTGSATLSIRELGAKLGTDPTAVYRHFRSKDDLMGALLDELTVRSLAAVTAPPENWQDRLRQLASATLDELSRYPAVGQEAIVLTTHGPGELDAIEFMLDAFSRAGLDGRRPRAALRLDGDARPVVRRRRRAGADRARAPPRPRAPARGSRALCWSTPSTTPTSRRSRRSCSLSRIASSSPSASSGSSAPPNAPRCPPERRGGD